MTLDIRLNQTSREIVTEDTKLTAGMILRDCNSSNILLLHVGSDECFTIVERHQGSECQLYSINSFLGYTILARNSVLTIDY